MEGDKVRGRWKRLGLQGDGRVCWRRPGPAPAGSARGAVPPRAFLPLQEGPEGAAAAGHGCRPAWLVPPAPGTLCCRCLGACQSRPLTRPRLAAATRVPWRRMSQGMWGSKGSKQPQCFFCWPWDPPWHSCDSSSRLVLSARRCKAHPSSGSEEVLILLAEGWGRISHGPFCRRG